MAFKIITAPAAEPVLIADVYAQTGLTTTDGLDSVITRRITEARQYVEEYCQRAIITQTLEFALDEFPEAEIEIPRVPAASITSVKYIDEDGVEQTVSSGDYSLDDYNLRHWILPAYDTAWPTTRDQANAVKVRYVAGYGASGSYVPGPINEAILLIVGHWMRFQPGVESGNITRIPLAALDLLGPYRMVLVK